MAVTITDIETSLGRSLSDSEIGQAKQWITDATMLITGRFGDHFPTLDPSLVDYVVRESVVGRLRNAGSDGATSVTIAVDDGNVTRRWEGQDSTGAHGATSWLIDGWLDLLSPTSDSSAFSTRPGFDRDDAQYAARTPGDPYIWDWNRDWQ